jgi:predicted ATP-dependent Lon-type protease
VSIKRETHQADAIGLKTRVCDFVAVPEQFNSRRPESSVKSSPAGVSWVKVLVKCPITSLIKCQTQSQAIKGKKSTVGDGVRMDIKTQIRRFHKIAHA